MAYKKTVIRQYFVALLKAANISVGQKVYGGRISPKSDDTYPYLTVYSKDEDIEEQFTEYTSRKLNLVIGIVVKDNTKGDADFDEVIENVMFEVEEVMSKVLTVQTKTATDPFALFECIVLTSTKTATDNSSSSDIGVAEMTYEIDYDYQLPITPITLEDFDWQGSIDNIIFTNPGVPANV